MSEITNKANEDMLNTLHQMVAQDLIERIQSGEASIQEINAAIKFLKDNEVIADITVSEPVKQLADTVIAELPFDTEDEDDTD